VPEILPGTPNKTFIESNEKETVSKMKGRAERHRKKEISESKKWASRRSIEKSCDLIGNRTRRLVA
jgi:hypothetical protein